MTDKSPLILDVRGNSLDDGPGIRTVVFVKGCPLACVWCHNPEARRLPVEMSFDAAECVRCDACLERCTDGALSRDRAPFVDRERCTLCFECVETCPSGALGRVGREMSADEVVAQALRDEPFWRTSGGGVTVSGGEPMLFPAFLSALLRALKSRGVHTLVETSGYFDFDDAAARVLPYVDAVYYDLKLYDEEAHRRFCGVRNARILENFTRLRARGGIELLPRTPLVPGITATPENLSAIADFLNRSGVSRARLMPWNPLWPRKAEKVGAPNACSGMPGLAGWMSADDVRSCEAVFRAAGVQV